MPPQSILGVNVLGTRELQEQGAHLERDLEAIYKE